MSTLKVKRPKGTQDITPSQIYKWNTVEETAKKVAQTYGFREIRIPVFEETGLFVRSVGDSTDVVQKEMYTVTASGDSQFTLRPEGTAGVMRAMIENGLLNESFPQKVFYNISCFRHEKPQAGRYREFHQFGCEMVGAAGPEADAEIICMISDILRMLGIKGVELNINSIGCSHCRLEYQNALKEYFSGRTEELCDTCRERLVRNPMRLLDCKSPVCSEIAKDAPVITDYLCCECAEHFEKLKSYLTALGIGFRVNPKIVRGLDYYTRTVFEFVTTDIGAQGTVFGGGRYDGLLEELGAKPCPALGFAVGLERLILVMEKQGLLFKEENGCEIYIAPIGEEAHKEAALLCRKLREAGFIAETDVMGRGLKAQMKYADKLGADYSVVIGTSELENGSACLKNMTTGEKRQLSLDENFSDAFADIFAADTLCGDELFDSGKGGR